MPDINIIIGLHAENDKDLFFGPLTEDDAFHYFPAHSDRETVFSQLKLFPSKSQARKAGQTGQFDSFESFFFGKKKVLITVINLSDETHSI